MTSILHHTEEQKLKKKVKDTVIYLYIILKVNISRYRKIALLVANHLPCSSQLQRIWLRTWQQGGCLGTQAFSGQHLEMVPEYSVVNLKNIFIVNCSSRTSEVTEPVLTQLHGQNEKGTGRFFLSSPHKSSGRDSEEGVMLSQSECLVICHGESWSSCQVTRWENMLLQKAVDLG